MAAGPILERNQDATIYVGGLGDEVSDNILWELFLQAGPVVNVHMPRDRITQAHQGYGFVEFLGEDDADYAIKIMNMIKLYGKPIRVNKASQYQKSLDIGANIFIGNLDPEVDEKLLYDTFSAFGVILQTPKIMRDPGSGNSRGFAFINFASFEASDAAIEAMNGQYLCNRAISISYAFKKDSKGERHGTAAERLLAAQNPLNLAGRPHQLFADAPPVAPPMGAPPVNLPPPPPPSGSASASLGFLPPGIPPPPLPSSAGSVGGNFHMPPFPKGLPFPPLPAGMVSSNMFPPVAPPPPPTPANMSKGENIPPPPRPAPHVGMPPFTGSSTPFHQQSQDSSTAESSEQWKNGFPPFHPRPPFPANVGWNQAPPKPPFGAPPPPLPPSQREDLQESRTGFPNIPAPPGNPRGPEMHPTPPGGMDMGGMFRPGMRPPSFGPPPGWRGAPPRPPPMAPPALPSD